METITKTTVRSEWFEDFTSQILMDQTLLDCNVASEKTQKLYDTLMTGSRMDICRLSYSLVADEFMKNALLKYVSELSAIKEKPIKLAMHIDKLKISVFAIIPDNMVDIEHDLYNIDAKVSAQFYDDGVCVTTTVLEESDNYQTPPQYSLLIDGIFSGSHKSGN